MDIEQEEMQFLSLFGIYKESYKLIFKYYKIFTQITLTLILPLSFIFLAQEKISEILYYQIGFNSFILSDTKVGTKKHNALSNLVSSEWTLLILVKVIYLVFVLVFSLLSTSAVVYTIASVYTSREITFKKVISVVPKVWKRLMVTFMCVFLTFCGYNIFFAVTLYLWDATIADSSLGGVIFIVILILYGLGFVYLTVIWQLASVVSVLEESYGFKAMIKSKGLIKEKLVVSIVIFLMLNLSFVIIKFVFRVSVGHGGFRIGDLGFGTLCLLMLMKMILLGLVVQSVIYFVCKSCRHENIDKSALSDHLEVYLGEKVPLMAKDVQMKEFDHV